LAENCFPICLFGFHFERKNPKKKFAHAKSFVYLGLRVKYRRRQAGGYLYPNLLVPGMFLDRMLNLSIFTVFYSMDNVSPTDNNRREFKEYFESGINITALRSCGVYLFHILREFSWKMKNNNFILKNFPLLFSKNP
jgi:hypothetical protein